MVREIIAIFEDVGINLYWTGWGDFLYSDHDDDRGLRENLHFFIGKHLKKLKPHPRYSFIMAYVLGKKNEQPEKES